MSNLYKLFLLKLMALSSLDHKLISEGYSSHFLYKAFDGDLVFDLSRCAPWSS